MWRQLAKLRASSIADPDTSPISVSDPDSVGNRDAKSVGNYDAFGPDQIRGRSAYQSLSGALAGVKRGTSGVGRNRGAGASSQAYRHDRGRELYRITQSIIVMRRLRDMAQ